MQTQTQNSLTYCSEMKNISTVCINSQYTLVTNAYGYQNHAIKKILNFTAGHHLNENYKKTLDLADILPAVTNTQIGTCYCLCPKSTSKIACASQLVIYT
ncbi:hypothetical protein FKM82_030632 [Ascaphus truei]